MDIYLITGVQNIFGNKMAKIQYKCYDCESDYKIIYDEDEVEDSPQYCCFCAAYIIKEEIDEDSDKYYVEDDEEDDRD